ncbi:MAG: hypothetical protein ABSH19_00195 [Opitutales bacterium]|jgi:hypothetical protein
MKRVWRWLLMGVGAVVVLLVVVVAVAGSATFQTAMALRYLRTIDPEAQLQSVSLGMSGGDLHGLVFTTGGMKLNLPDAAVSYSLSQLVFGQVKVINKMMATGLVVNLVTSPPATEAAPAAEAEKPATAGGGSSVALLIQEADLTGTLFLPAQRSVGVVMTAHDLGAGGNGTAQVQWTFKDEAKEAVVRVIEVNTNLSLALNDQMEPLDLDLMVKMAANLPGQTAPAKLAVQVTSAAPKSSGERDFSLAISQPGAGGNTTAGTQLVALAGAIQSGGASSGNFNVNCTSGQVAAFAMGEKLPDFDVRGSGQFSFDGSKGGSVKANLIGVAGGWEALSSALAGLGSVQFNADVDAAWSGKSAEARAVNLSLGPAGAKPALTLDLLMPVAVDFSGKTPRLTQGSGTEIARLTLQGVPAAWVGLGLPANETVTGSPTTGQVVLGAGADGTITAQTSQPIQFLGFNMTNNGTAVLSNVSLTLDAAARCKDGEGSVQVRELVVSSGVDPLAQLAANVTFGSTVAATGRLAVAIDKVAMQPFASAWGADLSSQPLKLDGTFDVEKRSDSLDVNALDAVVEQGATQLFTLKLLQKISVPTGPNAPAPALSGDLATLEADGLPAALANPFLPKGMVVSGEPLHGKLVLEGASGTSEFALRTDEPLTLSDFGYAKDGQTMLAGAEVTLTTSGNRSADGTTVNGATELQVTSQAGTLFDGQVQVTQAHGCVTAGFAATGSLNVVAAQPLGVAWSTALPAQPQNYSLTANITNDGSKTVVQEAEARVMAADGTGAPLAEVKLLQPVTIPGGNGGSAWPDLAGDLAAMQLSGLPVGVLGLVLPGYDLQGDKISADLLVHGEGGGVYSVAANLPLSIGRLTVRKGIEPVVDELTVGGRPVVKFSQDGLTSLAIYDLALGSIGSDLASGRIECQFKPGQSWPTQAKISLAANLGVLLKQPCLRAYDNINSGQATLDGELAANGSFILNADFTDWKVVLPARTVKEMALVGATGKLGPGSSWQVTAPLQGTGANGATNCTLSVASTLNAQNSGQAFNLNLTGNGLVPDDVMAMWNGFRPSNLSPAQQAGAPMPAASTQPDTSPMWGNTTASAQVNLQRLAFDALDLNNVRGTAAVSPTQASVGNLSAQLAGGAPLNFNGTLAFDAAQASQPYGLQANLSLTGFDTGAYFRLHDPNGKVPIDGKFSINGTTGGRGANTDDLLSRVPFNFTLSSNGGTIYVLSLVDKGTGAALTGLSVVTGVAGIFGGLLQAKAPNVQQFSNTVSQLTTLFDKIDYSSMTFAATRGADRNINLTKLNVQSTDIVVNGSGRIAYRANTPIPEQPLVVNVQLGVKGNPAALLSTLQLTQSSTPDANGFVLGPSFQVTGTLEKPNYKGFYNLLIQAPMKMLNIGM